MRAFLCTIKHICMVRRAITLYKTLGLNYQRIILFKNDYRGSWPLLNSKIPKKPFKDGCFLICTKFLQACRFLHFYRCFVLRNSPQQRSTDIEHFTNKKSQH